jgi:hypothetical protein
VVFWKFWKRRSLFPSPSKSKGGLPQRTAAAVVDIGDCEGVGFSPLTEAEHA